MAKPKPKIIVDTREKTPWDWEADDAFEEVIHRKLDGGDYSIEGLEDIIVIERKASADELFLNFSQQKKRITAEFERLADHKHKIIIVEETCEDVLNPERYYVNKKRINKRSPMMPVAVVAKGLNNLMLSYGASVIFGGMKAQSMARGILLAAWELHLKDEL
jgi:ERCC4-type nuclease